MIETPEVKPNKKGKRVIIILLGFFLFLCIIVIFASNQSEKPTQPNSTTSAPHAFVPYSPPPPSSEPNPTPTPVVDEGRWSYNASYDQMRQITTVFATLESSSILNFDFPYNGGATPSIQLRKEGNGSSEAMLKIDKGQFMTSYDGTRIAAKGDNGPVQYFEGDESANGRSDILFIEPASRLIALLKKSAHVTLEAPFYEAGRIQMEFETTGLVWPP